MSPEQVSAFLAAAEPDARHYPLSSCLHELVSDLLRRSAFSGAIWTSARASCAWSGPGACGRSPKTGKTRRVDMSEQLVRTLRRLEVDRMVEKVKRGWAEMPPWVFCTDEGTPLDESRVRKAFSFALRRAKLPSFRVYDLRHTYASLLLAQSAPITYVSEQLGHTDATTTTFRWYARWIPRAGKRVVDALDEPRPFEKLRLEATQGGKVGDQLVTNLGPKAKSGTPRYPKCPI